MKLALGTDWNGAPLEPMWTLHAAVTRATIDGKRPDGWVPEQKITLEIEKPKPDANPMMTMAEGVASIQKALFEASGLSVVSDSWLNMPLSGNLSLPDEEAKGLAELTGTLNAIKSASTKDIVLENIAGAVFDL